MRTIEQENLFKSWHNPPWLEDHFYSYHSRIDHTFIHTKSLAILNTEKINISVIKGNFVIKTVVN